MAETKLAKMFRARNAGELLPRFNAAERRWQETLVRMQAMADPVEEAHLQHLAEQLDPALSDDWVQRPDGNFESKLTRGKNNG